MGPCEYIYTTVAEYESAHPDYAVIARVATALDGIDLGGGPR